MIGKTLRKLTAIFDVIIIGSFSLACVVVVVQTVSIAGNTIMAYLANRSISQVESFAGSGILYITFLSAAWLLRNERHVRMDLVTNRLSSRKQSVLVVINSIIGIGICVVITVYGARVTWDHWVRGVSDPFMIEGFPKAILLAVIPLGSFLLSIQFVRRACGALEGILKPGVKVDTGNLESLI